MVIVERETLLHQVPAWTRERSGIQGIISYSREVTVTMDIQWSQPAHGSGSGAPWGSKM